MGDDLHSRLEAAITARLEVARAALPWPTVGVAVVEQVADLLPWVASDYIAAHIALHDPADAIRRYERDLKVLERHRPDGGYGRPLCDYCYNPVRDSRWPCSDIRDLLDVYPEAREPIQPTTEE